MASGLKPGQAPGKPSTKSGSFFATRDSKNEVNININPAYRWHVLISKSPDFATGVLHFDDRDQVPLLTNAKLERGFELDGSNGRIRFKDAAALNTWNSKKGKMGEARCKVTITIPLSDCKVRAFALETAYVIELELAAGKAFVPVLEYEPPRSAFPQNTVTGANVALWRNKDRLPEARHLKFVLRGYKSVVRFDVPRVEQIISGNLTRTGEETCRKYVEMQKNAVNAEEKEQTDALEKLGRDQIEVEVVANPDRPLNPNVFVDAKGHWKLEMGLDVHFDSADFVPGTAPALHEPGKNDGSWQIAIERKEGQRWLGTFNNKLAGTDVMWLTSRGHHARVKAKVTSKDPEAKKLLEAINLLDVRMKLELKLEPGRASPDTIARMKAIKISVVEKLIPTFAKDFGKDLDQSLVFKNGRSFFDMSRFQDVTDRQQLAFLQQAVKSTLCVCQGPPGTGKTTLLSRLICLLFQTTLKGNVFLTAHSNIAVEVLVEKTVILMKALGIDPRQHICWVRSQASYSRIAASGRPIPREVEEISLESHIDRFYSNNSRSAQAFRAGRKEIKDLGHIYDPAKKKAYHDARSYAYGQLRSKLRIWACRLSTTTNSIFVGTKDHPIVPSCDVLIMDEASQATTPYEMLAWLNLNPSRLIIVGDHEQLAPYTTSREAKDAWRRSWIQQIIERRYDGVVVLETQYRHPFEIGNAVSKTHYNGRVRPHPSCDRAVWRVNFCNAVKRITFVDASGKTFRLSQRVHFFDILNGVCETNPDDTSSYNDAEVIFVQGLVGALNSIDVRNDSIMVLTAYEAQFSKLEHRLPGVIARKVDSSQGDQKDVVILTTVRTGNNIGFLNNSHRQCVATSRAKNVQYPVGSGFTLRRVPTWRTYLDTLGNDQGPDWHFKIQAPVRWYKDGQSINQTTLAFRPQTGPPSITPSPRPVHQSPMNSPPSAMPSPRPAHQSPMQSPAVTPSPRHAMPYSITSPRGQAVTPSPRHTTPYSIISPRGQAMTSSPKHATPYSTTAPRGQIASTRPAATSQEEARARLLPQGQDTGTWAKSTIMLIMWGIWNSGNITAGNETLARAFAASPIPLTQEQIADIETYFRFLWIADKQKAGAKQSS